MVTKVQKLGRDVGQVVLVAGPILSYVRIPTGFTTQ